MTAKELFSKHFNGLHYDDITCEKIEKYAIEFAKFHVELALISAAEEASVSMKEGMDYYYEDYVKGVNKASILNAYPIENIK